MAHFIPVLAFSGHRALDHQRVGARHLGVEHGQQSLQGVRMQTRVGRIPCVQSTRQLVDVVLPLLQEHAGHGHQQIHIAQVGQCPSPRQSQPQQDAPGGPSLPVWWPGRFAAEDNTPVRVLAAYDAPDADFWLADLPLQSVPPYIFEQWQALYGVNLSADFLKGQPLVVSGDYGQGHYVLSYSHLETPHSPDANAWLAQLLQQLTGLEPSRADVPLWQLRHPCHAWPEDSGPLLAALRHMRGLLDLAVEHHLFFARTHWLWGWRAGLPGAACNNLHAALCTAASLAPSPAALAYWREVEPRFSKLADLFAAGAEGYFLACRLAETLHPTLPDAVDRRGLDNQRQALFGHPMSGGGLMEELLDITEELIFLSQDATPCDLR